MNSAGADSSNQANNGSAANSGRQDAEYYVNLLRAWHARIQKEVEQWIPLTQEEIEARNSENQTQKSQKEDISRLFRPERAGLGAENLTPETSGRGGLDNSFASGGELEKLRKQLLGKKAKKSAERAGGDKAKGHQKNQGHVATNKIQNRDTSSDDSGSDEGRSSAFQSKRPSRIPFRTPARPLPGEQDQTPAGKSLELTAGGSDDQTKDAKNSTMAEPAQAEAVPPAKRKRSFLDEVLAQKQMKKSKKKKG